MLSMVLISDAKKKIIKGLERHSGDTGSPEVQVGLLSQRIEELSVHLKGHKKDQHSRRGLLNMVNKRRKLLVYIRKKDESKYHSLTKKLDLEK